MCLKEIYYNTYADGAKDVTEKLYPCREGRVSHQPEVHKYDRSLPYTSKSRDGIPDSPRALRSSHHFLGDLPTPPRRSKSPSPAHRERRDSVTYIPGSGVADILKASSKHLHAHHERLPTRRSSRHGHHHHHVAVPPSPPEPPALPKLKRSMTSPHYVVIEQDQPRLSKHDVPLGGPIHIVDEAPRPRRRNSTKAYVVQDDERERRREKRDQKRRLSTTFPEVTTAAGSSSIPKVYVSEPPRLGLRRSNTATATIAASLASTTSIGSSSAAKQHPSKRLRFEDEVRRARERQNAEIAKRMTQPQVHQEAAAATGGLKGILKKATAMGSFKGKERAAEPTSREREELDLYDKDRLAARFAAGDEGSDTARERRSRRTKVWTGDRYQYL